MITQVLLAQKDKYIGGWLGGIGPLGNTPGFIFPQWALDFFNKVISNIVGLLTVIAGIWFIFQFIIGAFSYLTSGGEKMGTEKAQKKITSAIVGLAIVVSAIFLIEIIGNLLGLKILQPGEFILNMWK